MVKAISGVGNMSVLQLSDIKSSIPTAGGKSAVLQKVTIDDISLRSNFLDLSTPESRFEFLVSSKSNSARVNRAVAIERALFPSDIYISGKIEEGFKLSDFVERFNENGSTTTFGRYIMQLLLVRHLRVLA